MHERLGEHPKCRICTREEYARGFCVRHYREFRKCRTAIMPIQAANQTCTSCGRHLPQLPLSVWRVLGPEKVLCPNCFYTAATPAMRVRAWAVYAAAYAEQDDARAAEEQAEAEAAAEEWPQP